MTQKCLRKQCPLAYIGELYDRDEFCCFNYPDTQPNWNSK